jgi:hypothetical protein
MSRDDAVLIIKCTIKGRVGYIVLHVQAFEEYDSWNWVTWRVFEMFNGKRVPFTRKHSVATRIANKIAAASVDNEDWPGEIEYGIMDLDHGTMVLDLNDDMSPVHVTRP